MSGLIYQLATCLGFVVLGGAAIAALAVVAVLAIRYWPVSGCRITEKKRRYRHGGVPRIDWRTELGSFTQINALVGLTSRGRTRWFFGLMLMGPEGHDERLRDWKGRK